MSDVTSPAENPELAAQEVLIALLQSGKATSVNGQPDGEHLAKGLIELHEKLTAYYRALPGAQ